MCGYITQQPGMVNRLGPLDLPSHQPILYVQVLTAVVDLKLCPEAAEPFFTMMNHLLPGLEQPAVREGMRKPEVLAGNPGLKRRRLC